MNDKSTISIIVIFAALMSIGTFSLLKAQAQQEFSALLSGKDEVPPTESNSTGTAKFVVNEDSSQVSYWVNITGIKKINQAHIHNGTSGENGDVVVTLSKSKSAKGKDTPPKIGFSGNITKDDLQGQLKDKEISYLIGLMSDGNAYVNVHTDKYSDGAIRGQIQSQSAEGLSPSNETSPVTNESSSMTTMTPPANETSPVTNESSMTTMTPPANETSPVTNESSMSNVAQYNMSSASSSMDIDESMK